MTRKEIALTIPFFLSSPGMNEISFFFLFVLKIKTNLLPYKKKTKKRELLRRCAAVSVVARLLQTGTFLRVRSQPSRR